jgi:hypothetical protein
MSMDKGFGRYKISTLGNQGNNMESEKSGHIVGRRGWKYKFLSSISSIRKTNNTIWELDGDNSVKLITFRELSRVGVAYFEALFRELEESHIVEQMQIVRLFPFFLIGI